MTLIILKPNVTAKANIGNVLRIFEAHSFRVIGLKMECLSTAGAMSFYRDHQGKPFFPALVEFMTSGPLVIAAVELEHGSDEVGCSRALVREIRKCFGETTNINAIHGSDSDEAAKREIAFFFEKDELFSRHTS